MTAPGTTRAIVALGWPMFVGQIAVMANGIIDTVMAGRLSSAELAAVAIGASIYQIVFVGLMGTLQSISPVAAQHYGAGRMAEVGEAWRQGRWLALGLLVPGAIALAYPGALLALADVDPSVRSGATAYLNALALGLPAALWFRAFGTFSVAVSRPRTVMAINLGDAEQTVPITVAGYAADRSIQAVRFDAEHAAVMLEPRTVGALAATPLPAQSMTLLTIP